MRRHTIEIFQDAAGEFRWRLRAPNGRIVADGSEGYSRRRDAARAARRIGAAAVVAGVSHR